MIACSERDREFTFAKKCFLTVPVAVFELKPDEVVYDVEVHLFYFLTCSTVLAVYFLAVLHCVLCLTEFCSVE